MKKNASLKEIGDILKKSRETLIFPHVNMDGDALGSSVALCRALRDMGRRAYIVTVEEIPGYIDFIADDDAGCFDDGSGCTDEPDVCICVDCSEVSRIPGREDLFMKGGTRIAVDHHLTGDIEADMYYVDSGEAAAAQIVFKLLKEMDAGITPHVAEPLYAGIVTDTGSFQYSNTTPETHRIAAELMESGMDHMRTSVSVYQSVTFGKLRMRAAVTENLEMICGGRGAVSYLTGDMINECGGTGEDAEDMIDTVRNIKGVEVAAFLKERDGRIKVSLRAKSDARVDGIAAKFGGGGHMKAAGCTMDKTMQEALDTVKKEIEAYLENDI